MGEKGPPGIQGLSGGKGEMGSQGLQGSPGLLGPQGMPGLRGVKGDIQYWKVKSIQYRIELYITK